MNLEEVLPEAWFPAMRQSMTSHRDKVIYRNPFGAFQGFFRIPRVCLNQEECPMARPHPNQNTLTCQAQTRCILNYPTEKNMETLK